MSNNYEILLPPFGILTLINFANNLLLWVESVGLIEVLQNMVPQKKYTNFSFVEWTTHSEGYEYRHSSIYIRNEGTNKKPGKWKLLKSTLLSSTNRKLRKSRNACMYYQIDPNWVSGTPLIIQKQFGIIENIQS